MVVMKQMEVVDVQFVTSARALKLAGRFDKTLCDEAAARFTFEDVTRCAFELTIKVISKECWQVKGQMSADIVQSCIATGAPVKEHIDAEIEERFVPTFEEHDEIDVTDSSVEVLQDGKIPLGEVLMQTLGLAANPYPRVENAPDNFEFGPKIEKENPFSKLIHLKK